ncbi:hypothetical protein Ciccas_008428 [Cichlidogyrus casuarinus]|uniref:Uncharacterized protein n=1 Tax=Cichlidogyrus casuarinus TaxID=1844966 RepID=A0ABD2PZX9_9PLAT
MEDFPMVLLAFRNTPHDVNGRMLSPAEMLLDGRGADGNDPRGVDGTFVEADEDDEGKGNSTKPETGGAEAAKYGRVLDRNDHFFTVLIGSKKETVSTKSQTSTAARGDEDVHRARGMRGNTEWIITSADQRSSGDEEIGKETSC